MNSLINLTHVFFLTKHKFLFMAQQALILRYDKTVIYLYLNQHPNAEQFRWNQLFHNMPPGRPYCPFVITSLIREN